MLFVVKFILLLIHTTCGFPAVGSEGHGSPICCVSSYLVERETTLEQGRKTAKRGQEKQIKRMEKQLIKNARMLEMGDNILLPTPEVGKRSSFDPSNLPWVITNRSEEGYYIILVLRLNRCYFSIEFEFSHSSFLSPEEVPGSIVTLRKAILLSSRGKSKQACDCTSGCDSNRCMCRRSQKLCKSKCHKKLSCHNK